MSRIPVRRPAPGAVALLVLLAVGVAASARAAAGPLPEWNRPAAYSVDLEMSSDGQTFTMQQAVDGARSRSRVLMDGREMIVLDLPDDGGTTYMVMPSEKMAMKQKASDMAATADEPATKAAPESDVKIESLGPDPVDGAAAQKYRISSSDGVVLAWFDAGTSAPLRMESDAGGHKSVIRWKNWKPGPQKAELFAVPKDYEVQDLAEISRMMQSMPGGMPGGMPGMSMPGGGMGGFAGQMGSQLGGGLGSQLGASFGGPLGAAAGQYIGGKVGGMIGRKTAGATKVGR